ncbi:MAG: tetraacyldisaccharide 4'-kinase [Phycisphaeraceae bacterium]
MTLREQALRAMSGEDATLRGAALRGALSIAAPIYALGNAARSAGFAAGLKRTHKLGRPAISIGNLTTGGTGKTPTVAYVARYLIGRGQRPCVLLRGYRGGDEAEEHKRLLGDAAHVEPNPDRVAAASIALNEDPSITCFLLDDGFQHRRARRDLDLVLIDATNPWGYGHLLPRGLMREPRSALRRADAVIVTRADQVDAATLAKLDNDVQRITGGDPIAHAEHAWTGLREGEDKRLPLSTLEDMSVMGVVGIGNPDAFAATLAHHAGAVVHCEKLPDHHRYTRKQLLQLTELAKTAGARAVVTTEKDWVKWAVLLEDESPALPIYRAELSMRLRDGEAELRAVLDRAVVNA